jgi:hypothetical protein
MTDIQNAYLTLADFKRTIEPPGQTLSIDASDDEVIGTLIETASRRVDDLCGRKFYPSVQTRKYDIPEGRELWMDDDLLSVLIFSNGPTVAPAHTIKVAIAATDYILLPANDYPKYALRLAYNSGEYFEADDDNNSEQAIEVSAIWGYHEQYATRAWKAAGTLGVAWASTTTLTATMTAGHTLDAAGGQILKIDNELFNSSSVVANTLTVQYRGDNGSTAATHLINAPVYVWQPMKDISLLTSEITRIMYRSRYGENVDVVSTYTPSGVIVTPRSLPVWAQEIIRKYQRLV